MNNIDEDNIDEEYIRTLLGAADELDADDELEEDDGDEQFDLDEDALAAIFYDYGEEEALDYAYQEGRAWRKEFAENLRRLASERHFYSDTDEYVEEQDSQSGEIVRLIPGMHLCKEDE